MVPVIIFRRMAMMFVIIALFYAACHKKTGHGEQNKRNQPFFTIIAHNDHFILFLIGKTLPEMIWAEKQGFPPVDGAKV